MGWVLIHYQDTEAPLTADTALLAGPELWGGYRKKDKKNWFNFPSHFFPLPSYQMNERVNRDKTPFSSSDPQWQILSVFSLNYFLRRSITVIVAVILRLKITQILLVKSPELLEQWVLNFIFCQRRSEGFPHWIWRLRLQLQDSGECPHKDYCIAWPDGWLESLSVYWRFSKLFWIELQFEWWSCTIPTGG